MAGAWPRMRRGSVKGLHQARVASRRIREALPIAGAGADRAGLGKLGRKVRAITRVLGPVRALDVERGVLDDLRRTLPAHRAAVGEVRRHLMAERQALRARMLKRAARIDLERLVERLARLGPGRASAWRSALAARTVRRATRLREAIDRAGALYVPERLHRVRIAAKRLRYVLEVAEEAGIAGAGDLAQALKHVQGTLGRWHDLQSLVDRSRGVQASAGAARDGGDLDRFVQTLEQECRRLHAEFVVGREALVRIAARARREIAPQAVPGRPRAAHATVARGQHGTSRAAGAPPGVDVRPAAKAGGPDG
jgi:CHAD domain-containing protein